MLLDVSTESTPWTLHLSLESLTFSLCRLPLVHSFIMTPPALIGEGTVSEKMLDQALMESEVSNSKLHVISVQFVDNRKL